MFLFFRLVDEKRSPSSHKFLRLSDWFLRPSIIAKADNLDDLTRGLADQPEQTRDEFYDHEVLIIFILLYIFYLLYLFLQAKMNDYINKIG